MLISRLCIVSCAVLVSHSEEALAGVLEKHVLIRKHDAFESGTTNATSVAVGADGTLSGSGMSRTSHFSDVDNEDFSFVQALLDKMNIHREQGDGSAPPTFSTDCASILRAGWKFVRRTQGSSFKDKDQLEGTSSHGTVPVDCSNFDKSKPFAQPFHNTPFKMFLFTTGDASRWMIMDKQQVLAWYSNGDREIMSSHTNLIPYKAKLYRRKGKPEDPWITYRDHDHCAALYVEDSYDVKCKYPLGKLYGGLNVFIY